MLKKIDKKYRKYILMFYLFVKSFFLRKINIFVSCVKNIKFGANNKLYK
jgi:hypothetical protein